MIDIETCKPSQLSSYIVNDDGNCIMFLPCGVISFDSNDIREHYCARCHRFIIKNLRLRECSTLGAW